MQSCPKAKDVAEPVHGNAEGGKPVLVRLPHETQRQGQRLQAVMRVSSPGACAPPEAVLEAKRSKSECDSGRDADQPGQGQTLTDALVMEEDDEGGDGRGRRKYQVLEHSEPENARTGFPLREACTFKGSSVERKAPRLNEDAEAGRHQRSCLRNPQVGAALRAHHVSVRERVADVRDGFAGNGDRQPDPVRMNQRVCDGAEPGRPGDTERRPEGQRSGRHDEDRDAVPLSQLLVQPCLLIANRRHLSSVPPSPARSPRPTGCFVSSLRLGGCGLGLVGYLRTAECPSRQEAAMTEEHQTRVAKVVTIIGTSGESFALAAQAAVEEAAKTLRGITGADVVSMSCGVDGDRIVEYRTTVNIAFGVER
jgi:flavin-binding protein dodecin